MSTTFKYEKVIAKGDLEALKESLLEGNEQARVYGIKYLLENDTNGLSRRILMESIKRGKLDIVMFCIDGGCKLDYEVLHEASKGPSLDVLDYLIKEAFIRGMHNLANPNHRSTEIPPNTYSLKDGSWQIFKGLELYNRPYITEGAAVYGRLDNLERLVTKYPNSLNLFVTQSAAKHGHLDLLKWALENGCPVNMSILESLGVDKKEAMIKWLDNNYNRGFLWFKM